MSMQEQREGKMDAEKNSFRVCEGLCVYKHHWFGKHFCEAVQVGQARRQVRESTAWRATPKTCSICLYLHRLASHTHTTQTQNTTVGFMANLCITLGTLWVPVSGKCVWSDGEGWFWLRVKIINRQIHLHKSFQGFNLGQQLPAIHITDNRLISVSNLQPFYPCCVHVLFVMISPPRGVSVARREDLIILNHALTDTHQTIRQTFASRLILNQIKFKTAF